MATNDMSDTNNPNALLVPPSPIKEPNSKFPTQISEQNPPLSIEQIIEDIYGDFRLIQLMLKKCIVVLSDKVYGLMSKAFIAKVGDKLKRNKMIDLDAFLKKMNRIDDSLNQAISYLEWLKMNIDKLKDIEEKLKEDTRMSKMDIEKKYDPADLRNIMLGKENTGLKAMVGCQISGAVLGGVGGAVIGGSVLAGLIASVGILSAIGISGVAATGIGAIGSGVVVGLVGGVIIGVAIWLVKAYEIGESRKVAYKQVEEMDVEITQKDVIVKLSIVNSNLCRTMKQVRDATTPGYCLGNSFVPEELDRNRAIQAYKEAYQEVMEMTKSNAEEKRVKLAKLAARDACKEVLVVRYSYYNDDEAMDRFISDRIDTERELDSFPSAVESSDQVDN